MSDPNEILTDNGENKIDNNASNAKETEISGPTVTNEIPQLPTAAELEDLKKRASRADENWDRFLRLTAEFDNFKKRASRERQEAVKYANEDIINKLISVLDHFDMALIAAANSPDTSMDSFKTGITLIRNQLKGVLAEAGLEEVDASNKVFDPRLHEAVSTQESKDCPDGQVLQQLRMGYKLKDRLLRPATVIVAKQP